MGALSIGLLTNGLSALIETLVPSPLEWVRILVVVAVGIVLFLATVVLLLIAGSLQQSFAQDVLSANEKVARWRGLVALVSQGFNGSPQTRAAIKYHLADSERSSP